MTDKRISELTELTTPSTGDVLAIVNSNETKKIDWVNLGFMLQEGIFGGIHVHDNATPQSIPTGVTYTKLDAFSDNGPSSNMTPDATNDKITITSAGHYLVNCPLNFSAGTANTVWRASVFVNGVEQDSIHIMRKISTANDVGSASMSGIIDVTSVPVDIDVRVRHDNGGSVNVLVVYANLSLVYIGKT